MAPRPSLVNRGDDFVIRQYRIDVWHPCVTQIFDLCRDQSITEAALQASRLDHADCLRAALYLPSIMRTGLHNYAASFPTKMSIPPLRILRWYESVIPYSIRPGAPVQFSALHSCTSSLHPPPILRRKVAILRATSGTIISPSFANRSKC